MCMNCVINKLALLRINITSGVKASEVVTLQLYKTIETVFCSMVLTSDALLLN